MALAAWVTLVHARGRLARLVLQLMYFGSDGGGSLYADVPAHAADVFDPHISSSGGFQYLTIAGKVTGGSRTDVVVKFVSGTNGTDLHPVAEFLAGNGQCEFLFSERRYVNARDHATRKYRPLPVRPAELAGLPVSPNVDCVTYTP